MKMVDRKGGHKIQNDTKNDTKKRMNSLLLKQTSEMIVWGGR